MMRNDTIKKLFHLFPSQTLMAVPLKMVVQRNPKLNELIEID